MRRALLTCLVASAALAGGNGVGSGGLNNYPAPNPSSINPSNAPNIVQATTADLTLYVDPTGSDSNPCTAPGASACLTIQGAINKSPKLLRNQVTINIAAGTYVGALGTGFWDDNGVQQTSGGLLIDGALVTSTLATGSATGTALGAGQVAGSGSTFGVLCDSGAAWTSSDLIGRLITTASPANATFPITANTSTCATVAGTWNIPVTAQTTYTIQDPSVIIGTAVSLPAVPLSAASATNAGLIFANNNITYRNNAIVVRNIRFTNSSGDGLRINDGSLYAFTQLQVRPSNAAAIGISISPQAQGAIPLLTVSKSDINPSASSNQGVNVTSGKLNVTNSIVRSASGASLLIGGGTGTTTASLGTLSGVELTGAATALSVGTNASISSISSVRITCASSAGTGILLGQSSAASAPGTLSGISTTNIATCGTGARVNGVGAMDITSLTGAAATTGLSVQNGGFIIYGKTATTMTSSSVDLSVDTGNPNVVTGVFADMDAGTCLTGVYHGSRICVR